MEKWQYEQREKNIALRNALNAEIAQGKGLSEEQTDFIENYSPN